MPSEKEKILRAFYRRDFPSGIVEFEQELTTIVQNALGKSAIETHAYVQKNEKRLWNALKQRLDDDRRKGRHPLFQVKDYSDRRITWSPHEMMSAGTSAKEKSIGLRLRSIPYVLDAIDRLNDRQFEALCCIICEFVGASKIKLTPKGNEGGVDFFALISVHAKCYLFGGNDRPLRIIGQAKMYNDRVSVDKVKQLIQTINEVKEQNPSVERHVPSWFRSASGPVVGWLATHQGVQAGSSTKAKNHGIVVSDSLDMAEIAALSKQVDNTLTPRQRAKIVTDKAKQFLAVNSS